MVGGERLVGCGQISLSPNLKANGLNEAIPSQAMHNREIHIGWSYRVGHKGLLWIAYVCTLSDFL